MSIQSVREFVASLEARAAEVRAAGKKRLPDFVRVGLNREDLALADDWDALGFDMGEPSTRTLGEVPRDVHLPLWFRSPSRNLFVIPTGWRLAYRRLGLGPERTSGHRDFPTLKAALDFEMRDDS